MKIWFEKITKRDARLLKEWWDGNTTGRYFVRKRETDKYYNLIKQ